MLYKATHLLLRREHASGNSTAIGKRRNPVQWAGNHGTTTISVEANPSLPASGFQSEGHNGPERQGGDRKESLDKLRVIT